MKVGDLVVFSKAHHTRPGLDYTQSWLGLLVKIVMQEGHPREYHILWGHGLTAYPSKWINRLSYKPFEVYSEGG